MNVVIVESAAKAKAINKYLGSSFKVLASFGHVSDLPSKDGSVEPENDFAMKWEEDSKAAKVIREIADAVRSADKLILATDPDREGEAISWHILRLLEKRKVLKKGTPVERVAFNAVTKQAVLQAMQQPREIDSPLVSAYLARRALDYLVGFTLSPVLWRKLPGARSAGRVQSVALRLICDREAEIEAFKTEEYWTIEAQLATASGEDVLARLTHIDGQTLKRLDIKTEASALAIKAAIENNAFQVRSVDKRAVKRNPAPPFSTSTLQMDASRKLGFSAKQTMQIAQRLYEGLDIGGETVGLITYMRTDGVTIIPEAISAIRANVAATYGKRYVAPFIREYKAKAKNAQEAHEAIRPSDVSRLPRDIAQYLDRDQARLYELIWNRAVASQMASAELEQTSAEIGVSGRDGKSYGLRATGSVVTFDGFMKLYEEGRDARLRVIEKGKDDTADEEQSRGLPPLANGDHLKDRQIDADQHFTQPPPRYTEASLVKKMEELGIGRPSTYASTLAVLQERDYVRSERKQLIPEDKGRLVTAFLASYFERYVEYDFTAELEHKLDLISDDKLEWKQVLREFWRDFMNAVNEIKDLRVGEVLDALNEILGPHIFPDREDGKDPRLCPKCGGGRLSMKISSKFGAFIGCSNYPECRFTRQFSDADGEQSETAALDGRVLGQDPESGLDVVVKSGRFGAYLQLGEAASKEEKPKRAGIPKGLDPSVLELALALKLLSLPREVGLHPDTGQPITAALGQYGPYVKHEKTYANLPNWEDIFTIGLNHAVSLIADKVAGKGGRFQRAAPAVIKELGEHPEGGPIQILNGRYGPYVTHNKVNANIPSTKQPGALTLQEAIDLLAARLEKIGGSKTKAKAKTRKPTAKANGSAAGREPAAGKSARKADAVRTKAKPAAAKVKAGTAKAKPAAKKKVSRPKKLAETVKG